MLKIALIAAVAVLATAVTGPASLADAQKGKGKTMQPAASCAPGYQPVKVQGNWVCRRKTPNLPLKANTQGNKVGGASGLPTGVRMHKPFVRDW